MTHTNMDLCLFFCLLIIFFRNTFLIFPFIMDRFCDNNENERITKSMKNLESLFRGRKLAAEIALLRRMTPKIAVRLRRSKYSRTLLQLLKCCQRFQQNFSQDLNAVKAKLNDKRAIVSDEEAKSFMKHGKLISKICHLSKRAFDLAEYWHELKQLMVHFMMVSCFASRLNVMYKAIFVYYYDICQSISFLQTADTLKDLQKQMATLEIKPLQ